MGSRKSIELRESITFGESCIIEERVRIVNRGVRDPATNKFVKKDMKIGSHNLFFGMAGI